MARRILVAAQLAGVAVADVYHGNGFIGMGIDMFHPTCASACRDSLATYQLSCSTVTEDVQDQIVKQELKARSLSDRKLLRKRDDDDDDDDEDNDDSDNQKTNTVAATELFTTSPNCYASNEVYLESVAYCIATHCSIDNLDPLNSLGAMETWWETYLIGRDPNQPQPVMSFGDALTKAAPPGSPQLAAIWNGQVLTRTAVVDEEVYDANFNAMYYFEKAEEKHVDFGLAIFLSGLIIPILISWLRFIPLSPNLTSKFNATFIDPPLFGHRHRQPVGGTFLMPTRGQGIFIGYLFLVNFVFCAVGYTTTPDQPDTNAWFPSARSELLTYIANRTGIMCFANMPLLIVYSARNNPLLLWLTNWSHATYLMLHRWVAVIATLQAAIHALIYLYQNVSGGTYSAMSTLSFWIWGVICVVAMSVLVLPASVLALRRKMYEVFLATHVFLAITVLLAGYLHVWYRFDSQWGYENWLVYLAVPFWVSDRIVRVLRFARHGMVRARISLVTEFDDSCAGAEGSGSSGEGEYIRVDVPGVVAKGNAYLYFPTLNWRIWENHPFSVASNMLPADAFAAAPKGEYDGPSHEDWMLPSRSASVIGGTNPRRENLLRLTHSRAASSCSDITEIKTLLGVTPSSTTTITAGKDNEDKDKKGKKADIKEKLIEVPESPTSPVTPNKAPSIIKERTWSTASTPRNAAFGLDFPSSGSGHYFQRGSTFFIRAGTGMTARLRQLAAAKGPGSYATIPVLIESSYRSPTLTEIAEVPNVVVIAGGVGITAVAPLIQSRIAQPRGRTRLFWGLRSPALARAAEDVFGSEMLSDAVLGDIVVSDDVGARLDIPEILDNEVSRSARVETTVVVCGPESMADEVRAEVARLAKEGRVVRLVDEAYGW